MHRYAGTNLIERQIEAERLRERYRSDPDYRLYQVNKARRRNGRPPLNGVEQIGTEQPARDGKGRFVSC